MSCLWFACYGEYDLIAESSILERVFRRTVKQSTRRRSVEGLHRLGKNRGSPTALFLAIRKHYWDQVLSFLRNGQWEDPGALLDVMGPHSNRKEPSPKEQCMMWVVDTCGTKRLPLHRAILEEAPAIVLCRLLALYPEAINSRDSDALLPIQLALTVATSYTALSTLLDAWHEATIPQSHDRRLDDMTTRNRLMKILLERTNVKEEQNNICKKLISGIDAGLHIKAYRIHQLLEEHTRMLQLKSRETERAMEALGVPKSLWEDPQSRRQHADARCGFIYEK